MSPGFLFLLALLLYLDTSGIVMLSLLACVLHEFGHWLALEQMGNGVRGFCLTSFGAKIRPGIPLSYTREFAAAAAGPVVNLMLAVIFSCLPGGDAFAGVNLALAVFNLLPVGDLDGARMLRAMLYLSLPEGVAGMICGCLDFSFTLIFACLGGWFSVRYRNLTLLLMCLWLAVRNREEKMSDFQKKNGKRGCQTGIKRLK